jgi:glycosyltransferase involved in cell wall biosynthesis
VKIILIGTAYPYRGGLSAYNERMALEYLKEGNEVEIFTFKLQYPSFLFPGKTQYSSESAPPDLTIYRKINSINPFNWIKTGLEIKKKMPDLILVKFWLPFMAPCLGSIMRIARTNKKTKVIAVLDNIIPHEKRFADRLFASYFVGSADGFVAMSQSVLNDVELFDKVKPKAFCPHPLYDNFGEKLTRKDALARVGLDENKRYMLFFGFIRDYKGLDLLLNAFADKRFRKLNVQLIVAGEFYNNSEQYKILEEQLGLKGEVFWFNDFIPDTEVKNFFSLADIIVQPYKSATQSGVTQIAYHFEKPMLVTNVGGLAEIVPNGKVGYTVEPEQKAIADALVDFFENKRFDSFTDNILLEKKKYSWRRMTNTIDSLIQTLKNTKQKL